jgi:hypothetical protein
VDAVLYVSWFATASGFGARLEETTRAKEKDMRSAHRWVVVVGNENVDEMAVFGPYGSCKEAVEAMDSDTEIEYHASQPGTLGVHVEHEDVAGSNDASYLVAVPNERWLGMNAAVELLRAHEETGIDLLQWKPVKALVEYYLGEVGAAT